MYAYKHAQIRTHKHTHTYTAVYHYDHTLISNIKFGSAVNTKLMH